MTRLNLLFALPTIRSAAHRAFKGRGQETVNSFYSLTVSSKGGEKSMHYGNCGGYCEPEEYSKKDKEAILREQEAILTAKLVTIQHMIKNLDSKDESEKE